MSTTATPLHTSPNGASQTAQLEALYQRIAATTMHGMPLCNPALEVACVGFEAQDTTLQGILITPWCMNLIRMTQATLATTEPRYAAERAVGHKTQRKIGNQTFEFIRAWDATLGAYETCSLFSPMFEFESHAAALATAHEVLQQLRNPVSAAAAPAPASKPMANSRRAFLFGRTQSATPNKPEPL